MSGAHHLTPENIAAVIRDLREIEDGTTERPWEGLDWRTQAGVWHRIMSHLAAPAPPIQVAPSDIEQRTEKIRLAHAHPAARSHRQLIRDVDLLLGHIALLRSAAPVPQVAPEQMQAELDRAKRALIRAGFEDCGGQEWAPPIGPAPRFIEVAPEQASVRELEASMWRMKKLPIWDNLSHPLHLELDVMFAAIRALISKEAAPTSSSPDQLWQEAVSQAAFYVLNHCQDGEHHAEAIMSMPLPAMQPTTGKEPK